MFNEFQQYKSLSITQTQVSKLFQSFDVNKNGMIDYSEFIASFVMNKFKDYHTYLQEVFNNFDTNSDGQISAIEIQTFFKKHATLILGDDLARMIAKIDKDNNGAISMDELLDYVKESVDSNLKSKLREIEILQDNV